MKHKKKIMALLLASCLIVPTSKLHAASFNEEETIEIINSRVVEDDVPEIAAWETDLDGVVTAVTPLQERNENIRVPSDGAAYFFETYNPDYVKKNWTYKVAGTYRVVNTSSTPLNYTYSQVSTTTTNASVSGNITAKAEIKVAFVSKLEASLGITGTFSKTWTQGQTYGISQTLPGNTTCILTNYAVGANSDGALLYKKYVSGVFSGYYTETCGGTIISDSDINIVVDHVK